MSRLTRDGTVEPVSRDQILRHALGQENIHFSCSADHEQDWQPYPVDPYSAIIWDGHTYIHTYISSVQSATGAFRPAQQSTRATTGRKEFELANTDDSTAPYAPSTLLNSIGI